MEETQKVVEDQPVVEEGPKLSQEETLKTVQNSPTQALMYLQENMSRVFGKIANYQGSKKQLQRVLAALLETPFNKRPFKFSYVEEGELYNEFVIMQNAKLILLNASLEDMRASEQIRTENANKPKKEEVNGTTKEEV